MMTKKANQFTVTPDDDHIVPYFSFLLLPMPLPPPLLTRNLCGGVGVLLAPDDAGGAPPPLPASPLLLLLPLLLAAGAEDLLLLAVAVAVVCEAAVAEEDVDWEDFWKKDLPHTSNTHTYTHRSITRRISLEATTTRQDSNKMT
jgi:hypothetical protein